jgi:hypothetical protein
MANTNQPSGSGNAGQGFGTTAAQGMREAASKGAQVASEAKHRVQETAAPAVHSAQEGAQAAMHRAGELASDVARRAGDTLSSAASKASSMASDMGDRAEDAVGNVGERMRSLGGTIRERGPREGFLGSATSAVAGGLETSGEYLQEQGLSGMFYDINSVIRRYPVQALLVGVGIGFLMARAMSRE